MENHERKDALAAHDAVAPLLVAGPEAEATIAAQHGAAHLALAVATATAVLRELDPNPPAVVGTALGASALLLQNTPMPAACQAALLRSEPEPPMAPRPEAAYRWVRRGSLGDAATVTAVSGATVEEVVRAFGADPAAPVSLSELRAEFGIDPWGPCSPSSTTGGKAASCP